MNAPSMLSVSRPNTSNVEKSTWTHPDGSKRALYRWKGSSPPNTPALVFVHGFGEHLGRFQSFVDGLAPLGLTAVGYDHLGHGLSDGQRGDAVSVDALADDFGLILPTLLDLAGAQQAIVLGHSMGALTLARYLTRGRASTSVLAAILSGPAFVIPRHPLSASRSPSAESSPSFGLDSASPLASIRTVFRTTRKSSPTIRAIPLFMG